MTGLRRTNDTEGQVAPEIVQVAVARICASQTFERAGRLQRLLRLLMAAHLEKRPAEVSDIARDLYDKEDLEDAERRVPRDVRRLDDKLASYFEEEGIDDPIRVRMHPETLALHFELWESGLRPDPEAPRPLMRPSIRLIIVAAVAALLALVAFLIQTAPMKGGDKSDVQPEARLGVSGTHQENSLTDAVAAGTSAADLDLKGRDYLYPTLDIARKQTATIYFQQAIASDPTYAAGYASAAYNFGILSIMTAGSGRSKQYLGEAKSMLQSARELAPDDPWVLAAAALIAYAERDFDSAVALSTAAYAAGGNDPYVAGAYDLIGLVSGRYSEVRASTQIWRGAETERIRIGKVRSYAMASFYLAEYADVVTSLEAALAEGTEFNSLATMYLGAAHQALGNDDVAQKFIAELKTKWPDFRPELLATLFMRDVEDGDKLVELLTQAGWDFDN